MSIGDLPADIRQQLERNAPRRKSGPKARKSDPLDAPGVLEDWVTYGVSRDDFPDMPDKVASEVQMDWVVANFAVKGLDLKSAPSFQAISHLRECKRNPAYQSKYFAQHTALQVRRDSEGRQKKADDGRDLANTLRRLARIRAEAESLARQERKTARAAV